MTRIQDHLADMIDADSDFDENKIRNEANRLFKSQIKRYTDSGLNNIEALAAYCEDMEIDPEDITAYIDQNLLVDLTKTATDLRLLKKEHRANIVEL